MKQFKIDKEAAGGLFVLWNQIRFSHKFFGVEFSDPLLESVFLVAHDSIGSSNEAD